jgi:hypothetical protein
VPGAVQTKACCEGWMGSGIAQAEKIKMHNMKIKMYLAFINTAI